MGVPYTFGTATTSIPLSQLDANFNTPVTLGNTTVGLGNTVTTVGNLTLTNVTITSGTINAAVVDSGYVANSVVYADSTGVLTAGSANLVFTGTNVGIGTSSPAYRLDVRGSSSSNIDVVVGANTSTAVTDSKGVGFLLRGSDTSGTLKDAAAIRTLPTSDTYANTNLLFLNRTGDTLTERMRITSGGSLVVGGTTAYSKITSYGSGSTGIANIENSGLATSGGGSLSLYLGHDNNANRPFIQASTGNSGAAFDFSINPYGGNVGIGTSSPSEKLTVSGGCLLVTGGLSTLRASSASIDFQSNQARFIGTGADASTYPSLIFGNATTTTFEERMRITSGGYVGINTNNPTNYLQVNGGISSTSNSPNFQASAAIMDVSAGVARFNATGADNSTQGTLTFNTASANAGIFNERMRITSGGDVGIGTSSPSYKVDVNGRTRSSDFGMTNNTLNYYHFDNFTGNNFMGLPATSTLGIYVAGSERMRITSGGYTKISNDGTYVAVGSGYHEMRTTAADWILYSRNTNAAPLGILISYTQTPNGTGNGFLRCTDGGETTTRAEIRSNGGLANYSGNDVNLSDRREKTDFEPAKSYLNAICSIPVQTFKYIDQPDNEKTLGVVAQDVQAVAPELVSESNWGTEDEPKMRLSIYQTDLQYALMKCIQEQQAMIVELTNRIKNLEGAK